MKPHLVFPRYKGGRFVGRFECPGVDDGGCAAYPFDGTCGLVSWTDNLYLEELFAEVEWPEEWPLRVAVSWLPGEDGPELRPWTDPS